MPTGPATWRCVHIGPEGDDGSIAGLRVWAHEWRRVEVERIALPHPQYPDQTDTYDVYEIGDVARPVRFAAAEISNGVWGFYEPA